VASAAGRRFPAFDAGHARLELHVLEYMCQMPDTK
jgi:hypothetical protein